MPLPAHLAKIHRKNFHASCKQTNLDPIRAIWAECAEDQLSLLESGRYQGFRNACATGHALLIEWIWAQATTLVDPLVMIEADNYDAVSAVCTSGKLLTIIGLFSKIPAERKRSALLANACAAFRSACASGDLSAVNWLWEQYAELGNPIDVLAEQYFDAFYLACVHGHLAVAQSLWLRCPEANQLKMLKSKQWAVFWGTCAAGHAPIVAWLAEICAPEKRAAMIQAKKYACIKQTLISGHTAVFHALWSISWIKTQISKQWPDVLRDLARTKELARATSTPASSVIIEELLSEPSILRQLAENGTLAHYMGYFSEDKQAYFREVQQIKVAQQRFEEALSAEGLHLGANDVESAMRADLAKKAMGIRERVFANTRAEYESYGGSDSVRLAHIEKHIRQCLLTEIENDSQRAIHGYIGRHRRSLLMGEPRSVHGLSVLLLADPDANQKTAYIAWRAFDAQAETVEWPNLTTAPSAEDSRQECFSTKETYEGGALLLDTAYQLTREQVGRYFLACKDREDTRTAFVRYISEIRRAHNNTELGTDSPSCYPGVVTRCSQMLRAHPDYQEFFESSNNFIPIDNAFYGKLSAVFMAQCKAFTEVEAQYAHFDALSALRVSEAEKVLSDIYAASLGDMDLCDWIVHRHQIRAGILERYESPEQFIDELLAQLLAEERIRVIFPIDRCWLAYLLDGLASSDDTLGKLFYQLNLLWRSARADAESDAEAAPEEFEFGDLLSPPPALVVQFARPRSRGTSASSDSELRTPTPLLSASRGTLTSPPSGSATPDPSSSSEPVLSEGGAEGINKQPPVLCSTQRLDSRSGTPTNTVGSS